MIGLTSPTHLALLLLIALCLFGAKRLPEIGRSLGSGMREFKDSVTHQALLTGSDPATLGAPTLLPSRMTHTAADLIARDFGDAFAGALEGTS